MSKWKKVGEMMGGGRQERQDQTLHSLNNIS